MTFAYDNSVAETAASDVMQVVSALEATLDEMEGEVNKLAGSWEGEEQQQYQSVHGRWKGAADQAKGVLSQVKATLEENTSQVMEMRSRVKSAITGG